MGLVVIALMSIMTSRLSSGVEPKAPSTPIRTTLALPAELLEAVDKLVEQGKARSRNDLVANAVRHELAALERATLDAAFQRMATDTDYQVEARQVLAEFARSDWEAWAKSRAQKRRRKA